MILHLVSFRWKATVSAADVDHLSQELLAFRGQVGCILEYHFGPDLGLQPGNADFGIAALVASPEDLATYLGHPAHHALVRDVLGPMTASRQAVQIRAEAPLLSSGLS